MPKCQLFGFLSPFILVMYSVKIRFSCRIEFAFLAQFFVRAKFDAVQRQPSEDDRLTLAPFQNLCTIRNVEMSD